jgi:hypothetical protein
MAAAKKAPEANVESPDAETKVEAAAKPALGTAPERRADYIRALEEELDHVTRVGKSDRAKAVQAELKRVKSAPVGRKAAESDKA